MEVDNQYTLWQEKEYSCSLNSWELVEYLSSENEICVLGFFSLYTPYVFYQFSNYIVINNHLENLFRTHTPRPYHHQFWFSKSEA